MIRLHHCLGGISAVNLITSLVTAIIKLTLLELKLQLQNSLRSSDYCNYKTHFTRAITAIIKTHFTRAIIEMTKTRFTQVIISRMPTLRCGFILYY